MTDFRLTDSDKASTAWLRLKAHLINRLASARLQNDRLQPEQETAALRGKIAALKDILRLGDDEPEIETASLSE